MTTQGAPPAVIHPVLEMESVCVSGDGWWYVTCGAEQSCGWRIRFRVLAGLSEEKQADVLARHRKRHEPKKGEK